MIIFELSATLTPNLFMKFNKFTSIIQFYSLWMYYFIYWFHQKSGNDRFKKLKATNNHFSIN